MTNKITREKYEEELFDNIAKKYAKKDYIMSSSMARKDQIICALQPVLNKSNKLGTLVDIGCGIGAVAKYLAGYYERYIGIDQSKEMIRAAERYNKDNPKAEFIAKNIKCNNLPQNIADVILSDGALHHMSELEDAVKSLVMIAKPDSYLVIREPQNSNKIIQLMRKIRGCLDPAYSKKQICFSEEDLVSLLRKYNLKDIVVDMQGFLATPFSQVVMYPQFLFKPIAYLAIKLDRWLNKKLPKFLKRLSFNIVVIGRFCKDIK
jgi:ubiquinone/menaquinone biosynthesis C-methylase UbiE